MRNHKKTTRLWVFGAVALGVAGLALALATFLSAPDVSATETDSPSTAQPPSMEARAEARPEADSTAPGIEPIGVTVYEGTLAIPETVSADSAVFRVTNDGEQEHGFAVSTALSAPPEVRLDGPLATGQSEVLSTELQPGTYIAYCPIDDHQARERIDFTIER